MKIKENKFFWMLLIVSQLVSVVLFGLLVFSDFQQNKHIDSLGEMVSAQMSRSAADKK